MHTKQRAKERCQSRKCGSVSFARLPRVRSAVFGFRQNRPNAEDHKSTANSHRRRTRSNIEDPENSVNLMSQTLISVATKLEKVFNDSENPPHKVKRVYVIRFDDKKPESKACHKKYTRILYQKKPTIEGIAKEMKKSPSRSSNHTRCPSTASDAGMTQSFTTQDNNTSRSPPDSSGENSYSKAKYSSVEKDSGKNVSRESKIWEDPKEGRCETVKRDCRDWEMDKIRKTLNYKVVSREKVPRADQKDRISEIFRAILREIEDLSPNKDRANSLKKKTLREVIESNESLVAADYTLPPSMVNEEALDVLQALIDHKRRSRRRHRDKTDSNRGFSSLRRPISSMEWYGGRRPQSLNYNAELMLEPDENMAITSSSASSGPICRICHERLGTLVRPCRCRGSMAYVHVECLQTWLTEKDTNYCELCHYNFRVIHVPEYKLIPSIGFWYKFAATNQQRKRILVDLTLAVVLLPVLIFVTLFARSVSTDSASGELEDDEEFDDYLANFLRLAMVYSFRFLAFLINVFYVGAVFVRINHHLATWLSWYVNKNVTVVLEDRRPGSSGNGDEIQRSTP